MKYKSIIIYQMSCKSDSSYLIKLGINICSYWIFTSSGYITRLFRLLQIFQFYLLQKPIRTQPESLLLLLEKTSPEIWSVPNTRIAALEKLKQFIRRDVRSAEVRIKTVKRLEVDRPRDSHTLDAMILTLQWLDDRILNQSNSGCLRTFWLVEI